MRDARGALQKGIKALLDSAMAAVPAHTDLASCTSLPYTILGSDTLVEGPDKGDAGEITHTLTTWASTQTAVKANADTIISTLTTSTYTTDSPFSVDAAKLDFSGEILHDKGPDGSNVWGIPIRFRYIVSH